MTPKQIQLIDSWVMLNVEKKDGSRYVERDGLDKNITVFEITKSYLYISSNEAIPHGISYTLVGDTLIKRRRDTYKITELNDTSLVLLVNDDVRISDDKINKVVFIKLKYFGDSIINKNHIKYINDSTVELTRYFSPYYGRYWQTAISNKFRHTKIEGHVVLEVIMDSVGITKKINVIENNNISESIRDKVIETIKKSNTWMLWSLKRNDYYKINISVHFNSKEGSQNVGVKLFVSNPEYDLKIDKPKQLTKTEINLSNKYFQDGINYHKLNYLDSAVSSFTSCIAFDSLFIDAYYNRASINQFKGRQIEACRDWYLLSDKLGQKQAEKLYHEFCKKYE
ncbi:MAG: hypothetical protein JNM78_11755 [Cyclobacteriaceae bacterium]|nr:hypothetical protein [Cyclobacteriaceae bacterium]